MATNTQPQETPEYRTFREHYDRLYHAIQDPLSLATRLFTRSIITSAVKGKMVAMGLSTLEKNSLLLNAVEMQLRTYPKMFHEFLSALNEDPSMQSLVESMQSKFFYRQLHKFSLPPPIFCFIKGSKTCVAGNSLLLESKELKKTVIAGA